MSEIFINYRRDDTSGHAIHIAEFLAKKFGSNNIFLDMGMMPLENWQESIEAALQSAKILVVLIGKRWLSDRLYQKDDYVCKEIALALEKKIEILPVLLDGASAPGLYTVPAEIQLLTQVQMLQLSSVNSNQYIRDLDELSKQVEKKLLGDRTRGYISSDVVMFVVHRGEKDQMSFESINLKVTYRNTDVASTFVFRGKTGRIFLHPSAYALKPHLKTRSTHPRYYQSYTGQQIVSQWKPGAYYFEVGHNNDWKTWVPLLTSSSDKLFLRNTEYHPWTYSKFLNSFNPDPLELTFYELSKRHIQFLDSSGLRNST
jgi:hypothetical protein